MQARRLPQLDDECLFHESQYGSRLSRAAVDATKRGLGSVKGLWYDISHKDTRYRDTLALLISDVAAAFPSTTSSNVKKVCEKLGIPGHLTD